MAFTIKRGDRLPALRSSFSPATVDLDSATVRFIMIDANNVTVIDSAAAIIQETNPPIVQHDWLAGQTDTAGSYRAEWEVTFGDGRKETFPNAGYITIRIFPDLG